MQMNPIRTFIRREALGLSIAFFFGLMTFFIGWVAILEKGTVEFILLTILAILGAAATGMTLGGLIRRNFMLNEISPITNNEPAQTNEEKKAQDLQYEKSLEGTKTIRDNLKKLNCSEDILNDIMCDIPFNPIIILPFGTTYDQSTLDLQLKNKRLEPIHQKPFELEDCKPNTSLKKIIETLNKIYPSTAKLKNAINAVLIDDITQKPLNLESNIYINCIKESFTMSNEQSEGSIRNYELEKFAVEYHKQCIVNKQNVKPTSSDELSVRVLIERTSKRMNGFKEVVIDMETAPEYSKKSF